MADAPQGQLLSVKNMQTASSANPWVVATLVHDAPSFHP